MEEKIGPMDFMQQLKKMGFGMENSQIAKYDPHKMALMRVKTINETTGTLKGYDCPLCKNRGYTARLGEDDRIISVPCTCNHYRNCLRKLQDSGLGDNLRRHKFENFQADEPWQQTLLKSARAYAEKPEGWFLICGQSGSGKTHLCDSICQELMLHNRQVRYLPWRVEISFLKGYGQTEKRELEMEKYKNAEVLYIDDFLKVPGSALGEGPSQAELSVALSILGSRYNCGRQTILSTEYSPQEIISMDESLGSRILEMTKGRMHVVKKDRKRNYRLRGIVEI